MSPNDVHAALLAPARLVKHDGAIFVTDDKGMHLLRSVAVRCSEYLREGRPAHQTHLCL